jgi:hypothetical protein
VKYVDAGYIIALSTLFCYSVSLITRRRRLERAVREHDLDRAEVTGSHDDSVGSR